MPTLLQRGRFDRFRDLINYLVSVLMRHARYLDTGVLGRKSLRWRVEYAMLKHSLFEVKMFMQIKALKRNVQKQYSNLSSKENKNWDKCMLCVSLITKLST